jgi:hypothetical protein
MVPRLTAVVYAAAMIATTKNADLLTGALSAFRCDAWYVCAR